MEKVIFECILEGRMSLPGAVGRGSMQRGSSVQRRASGKGRTMGGCGWAEWKGLRWGPLIVRTLEGHTVFWS